MQIIIYESVLLFLKENKVRIKRDLNRICSRLKKNPEMYEPIDDDSIIRHFFIRNVEFAYYVGKDTIYISEARFTASSVKIKTSERQNNPQ